MLTYELEGKNKYYSLYEKIRDDILSGKIKSGDKLPSKRAMAENLSISVITVQTAYEQLLAEGYIYSKQRSGYFADEVNADFYGKRPAPEEATAPPAKYSLDFVKGGPISRLFPFSVWSHLMRKVLSDCGEHLMDRVPCDGDYQLKKAIAAYLYRARGIDVHPRYVVIGAGAEHLYGVIVQLLGRDKLFAVENPGYGKISKSYLLNGASCAYINVTDAGISLAEVEQSGADVVHFSPSHQFPTGAVTPVAQRLKLIKWARDNGKYIIEDDYDSEFRLVGKPMQCAYSLCPDNVIYMNTFSKSLAPSMRMGYMVLPPALYGRYMETFGHSACVVPLFEQKTLAAMLDGGHFERLISRLKNHYRTVRQAIYKKAGELPYPCVLEDTGSGLHLIAHFPSASGDSEIKEIAAKAGINIKCLSDYALAPAKLKERRAVINYSGISVADIENLKL